MNVLKITPDQIKLFETLGYYHNLGNRKAYFVPYFLVQHSGAVPDEFELIPISPESLAQWEEFKRLCEPNILQPHVVQLL